MPVYAWGPSALLQLPAIAWSRPPNCPAKPGNAGEENRKKLENGAEQTCGM